MAVRLRDRPGRVRDMDLIWEQVVVDAHDPVALGRDPSTPTAARTRRPARQHGAQDPAWSTTTAGAGWSWPPPAFTAEVIPHMFRIMVNPAGGVSSTLDHSSIQVVGRNMPGRGVM
jgi:hypothetical protein